MGVHRENPFHQVRSLLNEIEQFVAAQAKHFDADNLSGPQGFVIMHLLKHSDHIFSIKDIEEVLRLSKSVTSSLIKRMEKNGFVMVVPSVKDKRVKHVLLTDYGREQSVKLERFLDYIHEELLNGIEKADIDTTIRVFHQLQSNIQKEQTK